MIQEFSGSAKARGEKYGTIFRDGIVSNVATLLASGGPPWSRVPFRRNDPAFLSWQRKQEAILASQWPWLLEEMDGVAAGSGVSPDDILLLNLRAWQFGDYGMEEANCCSSMALTLSSGEIVCAGALDDPVEFYAGPLRMVPDEGYSYISFPLTGTSWGNRGLNCAGLAVGISSQQLPGLQKRVGSINQDLAVRVILQLCANVDDVREFCRSYPFTMNLVCVDASGGIFCAHQTTAGLQELPVKDGWCALTNHVANDLARIAISQHGVDSFPESESTRPRLAKLEAFCRTHNKTCSIAQIERFVENRDDSDPGSINNRQTAFMTYAVPQQDPSGLWISQPCSGTSEFFRATLLRTADTSAPDA